MGLHDFYSRQLLNTFYSSQEGSYPVGDLGKVHPDFQLKGCVTTSKKIPPLKR